MREKLIKKLITSLKCNSCDRNYEEDSIDIIEHSKELWFLRVFCPSCRTKSLVTAIIKKDEMPEAVTDLTEAELGRFKNMEAVRVDDVLDMHNFLKDFNGDFLCLFHNW